MDMQWAPAPTFVRRVEVDVAPIACWEVAGVRFPAAERLLCTARVQGVLVGQGGKVLNLGRTKRLATRAQRRALKVRDNGICQFPGCHQTTHLDAHHRKPWSHGGSTDLDNLILLCGRHHTLVHEGGLRIGLAPAGSARRWDFWMPEGRRVDADGYLAWRDVEDITMILARSDAA
jgi:HNH endonuclease